MSSLKEFWNEVPGPTVLKPFTMVIMGVAGLIFVGFCLGVTALFNHGILKK